MLLETEPQEIVGFDELGLQANRLAEARNGSIDPAIALVGDRQLVQHPCVLIVQSEIPKVVLDRPGMLVQGERNVPEPLVRTWRTGVQQGRMRQVSAGVLQITLALVGFAAFEVRGHGRRVEGECAAVRLDGEEGALVNDGLVSRGDEPLKLALPCDTVVDEDASHSDHQCETDENESAHSTQW